MRMDSSRLDYITRQLHGKSRPYKWRTISFQAIFLALFEEGFAADAEGFGGAADLVVRSLKSGGDGLPPHFLGGAGTGEWAGSAPRGGTPTFPKNVGVGEVIVCGRLGPGGVRGK